MTKPLAVLRWQWCLPLNTEEVISDNWNLFVAAGLLGIVVGVIVVLGMLTQLVGRPWEETVDRVAASHIRKLREWGRTNRPNQSHPNTFTSSAMMPANELPPSASSRGFAPPT